MSQIASPIVEKIVSNAIMNEAELYCCHKDRMGYIWIGSDKGVFRYDGTEIKRFTTENGLVSNLTFEIHEDSEGKIWFLSTIGALSYFKTDSCYSYWNKQPLDFAIQNQFISAIAHDTTGALYFTPSQSITNLGKIFKIENGKHSTSYLKKLKTSYYFAKEIAPNKYISGYYRDLANGKSDPNNLSRNFLIQNLNGNLKTVTLPWIFDYGKPQRFNVIPLKNDSLVLVSANNIAIYHDGEIVASRAIEGHAICAFVDNKKDLVIGLERKGILLFPQCKIESTPLAYFNGLSVTGICSNEIGGYWLSTLNNGLNYCHPLDLKQIDISDSLYSSYPTFNNDSLIFLRQNGRPALYYNLSENPGYDQIYCPVEQPIYINYLPSAKTYLFSDAFKTVNLNKSIILNEVIFSKIASTDRNFYGFIGNKIYKIEENKSVIPVLTSNPNGIRIKDIAIDPNGLCWVATESGIYTFDSTLKPFDFKKKYIPGEINSITFDNQGKLWINSYSDGVYVFNFKTNKLLNINELANKFNSILKTNSGNIVAVGDEKACMIDAETLKIKEGFFSEISGPFDRVFEGSKAFIFTSKNQITLYSKKHICELSRPNFLINSILVNDKKVNIELLTELNPNENSIEIATRVIGHKNNKKLYYRMNGVVNEWKPVNNNFISFPSLQFGSYLFEMALEDDLDRTLSFPIHIKTPFTQTTTFYLCCFLALSGITFLTTRMSHLKKQKKLVAEKKLINLELQALKAQINPHFLFNVLGSIQSFIVRNDNDNAVAQLGKVSRLLRLILKNSKNTFNTVENEIDTLVNYLEIEKIRFENDFEYVLDVSDDIDTISARIPTMIIQPFLENAVIHGMANKEGGIIKISFTLNKDNVCCTIEDNGIGINQSQKKDKISEHESVGITISTERLKLLHSAQHSETKLAITDLSDSNPENHGTRVAIVLPTKYTDI